MWKKLNIERIMKLLLIIAVSMFMLTACTGYNEEDNDQSSTPMQGDEKATVAEHNTCWQTMIITLLYRDMGQVAMGTYSKMTQGSLAFMMVAFAVWLSFRLLKHVSSVTEENLGEVWTEVGKQLFLCLACGYLASSTEGLLFFMNHVVFPVYNAFLEFASELLARAVNDKFKSITIWDWTLEAKAPAICRVSGTVKANASGFPEEPLEMMNCMICAMNERTNVGMLMALRVLKAPGFMSIIIGLIIIACFFIVKLGFVFYLVDSMFRFAVMTVMLPLLIMGYPFSATKGWLGKGFLTMISSAAFMMFMAIMIAIAMMGLQQIMIDNADIFFEKGQDKDFKSLSVPLMCLLMVGFLIASSVHIASQVSDKLVGGNSGSKFNAHAKAIIVGVGKAAIGLISGGLGSLAMKSAAVRRINQKASDVKNSVTSAVNNLAGR